jgi:hypothetical protein
MVNRLPAVLDVEAPGEAGGGVAVLDAQLAPGAVTIGVDRRLRHSEFAGDLLRRKMLVDQAQAFTFARGQQPDRIFSDGVARTHVSVSKR